MSRLDTLYVGTNLDAKTKPIEMVLGDIRQLTVDFSAYCGIEGTLIDSAAWSLVTGNNVVSIGTSATSTKTTAAPVTAVNAGVETVQVSTVLDNGEIVIHLFRCEVKDPSNVQRISDYP